ncbi:MAG: [FeFe] hydrogenase H-cluster maturation GTPase HydF [Odoribacteraceae bacterium]|nr:[FeFe] hydrogenase H-cluster maturation GTPase HydF [Odoribacteraceae bacterium]
MESGNKLGVILLGRRNSGKSSILNAVTGQQVSIVSPHPGTTTDPVPRGFEIPGFATILFIDTAGIDDDGELGRARVDRSLRAIERADVAILVLSNNRFGAGEEALLRRFEEDDLPFFIVHNKRDEEPLSALSRDRIAAAAGRVPLVEFSATTDSDAAPLLEALKEVGARAIPPPAVFIGDLFAPGDRVLLVTPIDAGAPTGRMILPQVQLLREVLDNRGVAIVALPEDAEATLRRESLPPALVVTDSQAFARVSAAVPEGIPLTSFSIALARRGGMFGKLLEGTPRVDGLREGDRVLILESCSHHPSGEDIGRQKIPAWLRKHHAGKEIFFDFVTGRDPLPRAAADYALAIQCGGCMVSARQLRQRLLPLLRAGVPVSNYGMMIAYLHGIFPRATRPFAGRF